MIEPVGGWGKFFKIFEMLGPLVYTTAEQAMDQFGTDTIEILRTDIEHQSFNHKPLSPRYLAWKKAMKLDPRILIATKTYIRALKAPDPQAETYRVGQTPTQKQWVIGPPKGTHQPSGLPYVTLARRLEFGVVSRNLPPRPHWRPTFARMAGPVRFIARMRKIGVDVERRLRTYLK